MSSGIEMRLWWGDHLVAEQFFFNGVDRRVRFGSAKDCEFPLAFSVAGASSHTLLELSRSGLPLLRFTEQMMGALYRPGAKPMSLDEVIAKELALEVDGCWSLALSTGDQLSLELGDLNVELRARAAPRRVRASLLASTDFRFANVLLAALAMATFLVITAVNHEPEGPSPWDDWSAIVPSVRYRPTIVPPAPPSVNVEAAVSKASPVAPTASASGPTRAKRAPSTPSGLPSLAPGLAVAALFKPGVGVSAEVRAALNAVAVASAAPGAAYGFGEQLHGGDPSARTLETIGSVGIKTKGRVETLVSGRLTNTKPAPMPEIEEEHGEAISPLDRELIRQVIRSNRAQFRYCYERLLNQFPTLEGKVSVHFVITGSGSVSTSTVASSSTGHPTLDSCVAAKVNGLHFPRTKGGGQVVVTYPFLFRQSGD